MKHKRHFTLIELLVSMGLLTLLVMLMLQLFSGAQRLWIASDRRNTVAADANAALELMSELINTVYFTRGEDASGNRDKTKDAVFSITKSGTEGEEEDSMIFATKTSRNLPRRANHIRFIAFQRGDTDKTEGNLYMTIYSDKENEDNFYSLFPPYGLTVGYTGVTSRGTAKNQLKTLLTPNTSDTEKETSQIIAENVIAFEITAYKINNSKKLEKISGNSGEIAEEPPHLIELSLTVMNKENYKRYTEMSGDAKTDFLNQNKSTFTRSIFIGDRWAFGAKSGTSGSN